MRIYFSMAALLYWKLQGEAVANAAFVSQTSKILGSFAIPSKNINSGFCKKANHYQLRHPQHSRCLWMSTNSEEEKKENEKKENPYNDPNYPELEFVDYSDPEYVVDQGISDEFFSAEAEIERMREDRRRKNDEYQFQTYFADILKGGEEYKGEWTIYKTSTFLPGLAGTDDAIDANGLPRLIQAKRTLKVITRGYKIEVDSDSSYPIDSERICHEERSVSDEESDPYKSYEDDIDTDGGFGHGDDDDEEEPSSEASLSEDEKQTEEEIMSNTYWPSQLSSFDFRGEQGIMVVGNGYTTCTSVPLDKTEDSSSSSSTSDTPAEITGPFSKHRVELGLQSKQSRFRVKFDYQTLQDKSDTSALPPPLHLKSIAVCREALGMWPPIPNSGKVRSSIDRSIEASLYGLPGAEGGLYDPPPVGSDKQALQYMLLDLEGRATILFPHKLQQDPNDVDYTSSGWVTSLDWAPDTQRYQIDRKVKGGIELTSLRTLELSEVQAADAETYRPRDGGRDMRQ